MTSNLKAFVTTSDKDVNMLANQPLFGYSDTINPNIVVKNLSWRNADLTKLDSANSDPMKRTTIISNLGGLRGVMPCKGLSQIGLVPSDRTVIRRPPENQMSGMYPTPIPGMRHMEDGLLTQPQYKRHPLMPIADSFNAGMISSLGQPA